MVAVAAVEAGVYDADVVLSFPDILAGKAGRREAEAARAWANGEIKAPPVPNYFEPVDPEPANDARAGHRKRKREVEGSGSSDQEEPQQHTSDADEAEAEAKQPPAPAPVYEPIQALGTKATLEAPPKPPAPAADLPPKPKPHSKAPAGPDAAPPPRSESGSGHTRVRPSKPVPDNFAVLTKIDSSGKIRKTFVTPDQKRWYTLKEAIAYWEAQGGPVTYLNPQPVDDTPPVATTPRGSSAAAAQPSTSGEGPRRIPRLPVPDQFTVTSKVDVTNKERKTWHTPDGRRFGTFREAASHWEGLGHELTYTKQQSTAPAAAPAPAPSTITPPPAPAPAPAAQPASTVKSSGEPTGRRGPPPLPVPDQFTVTIKSHPSGKERKIWNVPDGRKFGTFKEAAAYWEGLGHALTYAKQPPPSTATPPPYPSTSAPKSSGGSGRRGPAPIPVPDQFTVDIKINAAGKERKTWITPDGRKFGTFKEAKGHWEGLGHTLTYLTQRQQPTPAAAVSPAAATPAPAAASAEAGSSSDDEEGEGEGEGGSDGGDSGTEGASSDDGGEAARGGSGGRGRGQMTNAEKWLPPGWKSELKTRVRNNRNTGDWYYTSPSGVVYRSYVAAQQAFQTDVQGPPLDDLAALPGILRALARRETVAPHSGLAEALERVRQLRGKSA